MDCRLKWPLVGLMTLWAMTAQAKRYHVEMIVFKHQDQTALSQELWPLATELPDISQAQAIADSDYGLDELDEGPLPVSAPIKLTDASERLKKSKALRIISHQAWSQAIGRFPQTVYLNFGERYQSADEGFGMGLNQIPEFEGTLALKPGRFIQMQLDAVVHEPVSLVSDPIKINSHGEMVAQNRMILSPLGRRNVNRPESLYGFQLTESRKARTGEVHYFDHPVFGVMVYLEPITQSTASTVSLSLNDLGDDLKDWDGESRLTG